MKRLTPRYRAWMQFRAEAGMLARTRLREVRSRPRRRGARPFFDPDQHVLIQAPDALDLDAHCAATFGLIDRIREVALTKKRTAIVIMTRCTSIAPDAALLLAAEIQRCIHYRPGSINGNNPRDAAAREMLANLGFFKMLGFNEPRRVPAKDDSMRFIRMESGPSSAAGTSHVDKLSQVVLGDAATMPDAGTRELLRGLGEAMLNVQMWAYPDDLPTPFASMPGKRWWIAGYRNSAAREVVFMAHDQGVGIPTTLPRTWGEVCEEQLAKWGKKLGDPAATIDHTLIMAAMELGRTRSGLKKHGKGLNDFRRLVDLGAGGGLTILSGCGLYRYSHGGQEETVPLVRPLNGTMVIWRLVDSPFVQWTT